MAFMEPQIVYGLWVKCETREGTYYIDNDVVRASEGMHIMLDDVFEYLPCDGRAFIRAELIKGYGARLSAPGYLDCTEWAVFDTEGEAEDYLKNEYGDEE